MSYPPFGCPPPPPDAPRQWCCPVCGEVFVPVCAATGGHLLMPQREVQAAERMRLVEERLDFDPPPIASPNVGMDLIDLRAVLFVRSPFRRAIVCAFGGHLVAGTVIVAAAPTMLLNELRVTLAILALLSLLWFGLMRPYERRAAALLIERAAVHELKPEPGETIHSLARRFEAQLRGRPEPEPQFTLGHRVTRWLRTTLRWSRS